MVYYIHKSIQEILEIEQVTNALDQKFHILLEEVKSQEAELVELRKIELINEKASQEFENSKQENMRYINSLKSDILILSLKSTVFL